MNNLIFAGKMTALLSFVVGTIFLSFFLYFDPSESVLIIGLYYVIVTIVINGLLFLILLIASALYQKYRLNLLKTCGIILLNIPIAIGYFYLVLSIKFPSKG